MIIDKTAEFRTDEVITKLNAELDAMRTKQPETENPDDISVSDDVFERQLLINREITREYRAARTDKQLLNDAREILEAVTKKDYIDDINQNIMVYNHYKKKHGSTENDETAEHLLARTYMNYNTCYDFLTQCIIEQIIALNLGEKTANAKKNVEKARDLAHQKALEWYPERAGALLTYSHGAAVDALANMTSRRAITDIIAGTTKLEWQGVAMIFNGAIVKYGISAHKLLIMLLNRLAAQNNAGTITLPLSEYAQVTGGYNLIEHETSTPEEKQKEEKRLKNEKDRLRKDANENLKKLGGAISFEGKVKGKPKRYSNMWILSQSDVSGGEIHVKFNPDFVRYLTEQHTMTRYPVALAMIDGRDGNAYRIGNKLALRYYMDSNRKNGTNNRIQIKKLLEVTTFPTFEEVQKLDRNWQRRIKEPFEKALDTLTDVQTADTAGKPENKMLKNWEYVGAKGRILPDDEAENITSYTMFASLYLKFEMIDDINDAERITANEERRKKEQEKAEKRKQKIAEKQKQKSEETAPKTGSKTTL